MPTCISLPHYTEQGIRDIKNAPRRLDNARKVYQAVGAKLKEFYLVMGRHDAVAIAEAPYEATVASLWLGIGALGNVRSQTLRAFTEDEHGKIVGSLP